MPAASGYTYAIELSVDEAVQAGATSVDFSQPVSYYVENFLGFPVGQDVPVGYYDREKGLWLPEPDGRIIEVVSVTPAGADVDVDGDGVVDTGTKLTDLNITQPELETLGSLYTAGTSLWRVQLQHFSPWDLNWPYGPPGDACAPDDATCPLDDPKGPELEDDPCTQSGSIIECENQILGERIPVAGTPFTLNYRSDRAFGRKDAYTLSIQLTGSYLPPSVQSILLRVKIAGQKFEQTFLCPSECQLNKRVSFTWDGLDAYGHLLRGSQPADIEVGYQYPAEYMEPADLAQSFAAFSDVPMSGNAARTEIILWKHWQRVIGAFSVDAMGLGGFTLDPHHVYDPIGRVLYRGDGRRVNGRLMPPILTNVATNLGSPESVVVRPDGTILYADSTTCTIRRIALNGTISIVAGVPNQCSSAGDELLVTDPAVRVRPWSLALGPDGSVYIAELLSNRVRRIGPDQRITTFAGNGNASPAPVEGVQATSTRLPGPKAVAVSSSGDVYITAGANRVYRVDANGILTTVAGGGSSSYDVPAKSAYLDNPGALAVGQDGSLYIAVVNGQAVAHVGLDGIIQKVVNFAYPKALAAAPDGSVYVGGVRVSSSNSLDAVYVISPDGTISTIAGREINTTCPSHYCGLEGPAKAAKMYGINGLAVAPDGSVVVADRSDGRITQIKPSLPGVSAGSYLLPNEAATEAYHFNPLGRHVSTVDLRTGATIYAFGYNSDGRLTSITDRNNLPTTITYDPVSDAPTSIVAPFSQVTTLSVDAEGYLDLIENPAGEAVNMTYHPGTGLLHTLEDAKTQTHEFTYDALGRLWVDENPAGGSKTLVRTDVSNGYTVDLTTKLGRNTEYELTKLPDGSKRRKVTQPSTLSSETITDTSDKRVSTFPDGTTVTEVRTGDERFGMQAPVVSSVITKTGTPLKTREVTRTRSVTLSNPSNILSLASITEKTKINGKEFATTFVAATRTETTTTPEGRTLTRVFDTKGRTTSLQLGSLQPFEFLYGGSGRIETVRWGTTREWNYTYHPTTGYLQSVENPLLQSTTFLTDSVGRVTQGTRPDTEVIGLGYDPNGNPDEITPPDKPLHAMTYTPLDQIATYTAPPPAAGGQPAITTWTYDLDGKHDLETRPGNQVTDHAFDSAGRLDTITLPSGQGTIDYTYDPATGHMESIAGPSDLTLTIDYDGRLLSGRTWSGVGYPTGNVHHDHDATFRISSETVNGGHLVAMTYDNDGLLIGAGPLTLTRNSSTGQLNGSILGVVSDSYTPNLHGEVTDYEVAISGSTVYDVMYTRDALGRIDTLAETIGGQAKTFDYVYDAAGRLEEVIHVQTGATTHYDYDGNGNRLARVVSSPANTETGVYDDQDRLESYGGRTYTYTLAGELESTTVVVGGVPQLTSYVYDARSSLRHVQLPSGVAIDYIVDGLGRRIWKKRNGVLEQGFLYSDDLRPVAELDGLGNVVARFIYGRHRNVPDAMVKGGQTYRIVTDHLGSPRMVIDAATGAVVQRVDYDEFGRVLVDTNPGFQPLGFAGGIYDRDTGFVRFGARDYDAFTGRWTSKDPLRFGGGDANVYSYCLNDAVNCTDPTGLIAPAVLVGLVVGAELIAEGLLITGALATGGLAIDALINRLEDDDDDIVEAVDYRTPADVRRRYNCKGLSETLARICCMKETGWNPGLDELDDEGGSCPSDSSDNWQRKEYNDCMDQAGW
ncbi:RHS repeat-associated core domain-containing protein [Polyangium sp. y55x31]|nr:RHS repeat-associated core domain-containing protein [Polyangium sp. y55x31]